LGTACGAIGAEAAFGFLATAALLLLLLLLAFAKVLA
jgi:hypothetical protein